MTPEDLLRFTVAREADVFLLRQCGREVAATVGLDPQDQIRVATALSDVGRELIASRPSTRLVFRLRSEPEPTLVIAIGTVDVAGPGWDTARRLLDGFDVAGDHVDLVKSLPLGHSRPTAAQAAHLRDMLSLPAADVLEQLRAQNRDLLETLESLEVKRRDLVRLNDELEETNQGVVALHKELSEELEQTNLGVVAFYTELEEKSNQLRDAAAARTRFWSNISHELRSPVNSIIGLTRLLVAPGGDPLTDEQRRQIDLVNDAGSTLLALVNELLDTAKAESGSLRPKFAPVDVPLVLAQLQGTSRPMTRSADVRLVFDPAPPLSLISDEVMLQRVLRNLLSNALKFTERGTVRLSVRTDEQDEAVHFTVADTGIGIPPEEQTRIFEEFYQVPGRLQVGVAGTGLGLPYARRLARLLGGDIVLRSTAGEGTEMTLWLPRSETDVLNTDTALVVEADDAVRARVVISLDGVAHTVEQVKDGREALERVRVRRPDVVVLAADVPRVSGPEILSFLRSDDELRAVPVVVVAGGADPDLERLVTGLSAVLLNTAVIAPSTLRRALRDAVRLVRPEGAS
ncbi:sensor histidine kinase [Actinosynnema sp. NPDC047251]|uniref:histidine kinase n=1 Tax=Saccharothrix espanaensis (strain ATCC 51144 / DSM 44229 / JCM 9112 / NBRC 15066 / NRRL 15764) TaxID=1179773 RepID=K0JYM2_SACES|nr:sensor histidine kinase [Saccharothrix espanaensis]CCH33030.1 putative histidine kinase [Saccharothrix espanaensis DSM 44229]